MQFTICDVRGDGHCFYRALYQVIMQHRNVKLIDSFGLEDEDDELEGAKVLRLVLGNIMMLDKTAKKVIEEIFDIYHNVDDDTKNDLHEMYPLLESCSNMKECIEKIQRTNTFASSIEIEIFKEIFRMEQFSLEMIVVSESKNDQWEVDIMKVLQLTKCKKFCVLVNSDNIHYKYAMINGNTVNNVK